MEQLGPVGESERNTSTILPRDKCTRRTRASRTWRSGLVVDALVAREAAPEVANHVVLLLEHALDVLEWRRLAHARLELLLGEVQHRADLRREK